MTDVTGTVVEYGADIQCRPVDVTFLLGQWGKWLNRKCQKVIKQIYNQIKPNSVL